MVFRRRLQYNYARYSHHINNLRIKLVQVLQELVLLLNSSDQPSFQAQQRHFLHQMYLAQIFLPILTKPLNPPISAPAALALKHSNRLF